MSATFGTLFRVTVFGESHAAAVGCVIDGLPPGFSFDMENIRAAMRRRAPNAGAASTKRKETDQFEILCGYYQEKTTGTPLAAIIRNRDQRSSDYKELSELMRPGHADYTGWIKYRGAADIRGGGHFSGRLTAPLVFAGAAARQVLRAHGIEIGAHIASIGNVEDVPFRTFTKDELLASEQGNFPVLDTGRGEQMLEAVDEARRDLDSLGGWIECAAIGLPAGLGEPFFDSMESALAHMMFSVPAVKALTFGDGLLMPQMRGSEANDAPSVEDGIVSFRTNHSGGINGGITNGMPLVFRTAVRPTASISKPQETVNIRTKENAVLKLRGRHDACIVPRACEVIKNAAAVVLLDMLLCAGAVRGKDRD